MYQTKIDWCDSSWNPVTGCDHGCEYCYARAMTKRFGQTHEGKPFTMAGYEKAPGGLHILNNPCRYEGIVRGRYSINHVDPYPFGFAPTFHRYRLGMPARWTEPRNIFVCSMADLFGVGVPDEQIQEVYTACDAAPQHRYLFLTKNPRRLREHYAAKTLPYADNYWFGTTLTKPGDDFTWFKDTPYHTFISIEPIIEPFGEMESEQWPEWVIVGAETGQRKDKVVPEKWWIDEIASACAAEGVPLFMKESLRELMGDDFLQQFPWEV